MGKKIVFLILILHFIYQSPLHSQGEANNWYFGNNAGITFNTNPPSALINGTLNTIEGCASISDSNGDLLFYTDGVTVYNKNHVVMSNGTGLLGNPSSSQSAIIIPKPGISNRYYIITVPAINLSTNPNTPNPSNDMHYSEVDLSIGLGEVVLATKNTRLFGASSEKIAAIKHANGLYYWLIGREFKDRNNYHVFLVDCNGISQHTIFNNSLIPSLQGYLVASPDGSLLASASNTYGIEIIDFNPNTGNLSNVRYINNSLSSYGIAFSQNSNLLYSTNLQTGQLFQWDLQNNYSSTLIATIPSNPQVGGSVNIAGALQLGPDGKIYVAQPGTPFLGVINNPNIGGTNCDFNPNDLSLNNRICEVGLPPFVQSMVVPPLDIIITNNCVSDSIDFSLGNLTTGSTLSWNFGEPNSSQNTSSLTNPKHKYSSPGTYLVTVIRALPCAIDTFYKSFNILNNGQSTQQATICQGSTFIRPNGSVVNTAGTYLDTLLNASVNGCDSIITSIVSYNNPQFSAGNDMVICLGDSVQLNANVANVLEFSWDPDPTLSATNIPNPIASPSSSKSYILRSKSRIGNNLVTNGDFSLGNTGFSSGYTGVTGNTDQGLYAVTTNPNLHNNGFTNCGDHSTGNSNMLLVDGACGTNGVPANTVFWCQTIPVSPNTDYAFSAWLTNVAANAASSTLQFSINGIIVGTPPSTTITACQWDEFYVIWNSGIASSANICIAEGTGICNGNDFAVDDISFYEICEAIDTVNVKISNINATITGTNISCAGLNNGSASVIVTNGIAPYTYQWNNNQSSSNATNLGAGNYSVIISDSIHCKDTLSILITEPPKLIVSTSPSESFCAGLATTIEATASGGINPYTILWNNGHSSWTQHVQPTSTSAYIATITDANGCTVSDTILISIYPNPIADFYIIPSEEIISLGSEISIQDNSSGATSWIWEMGDDSKYLDNKSFTHTYESEGEFCIELIVISENNCTDNHRACIKVIADFIIYIPNSFTPNDDKLNTAFRIVANSYSSMTLSIFNRWGEEITRLEGDQPVLIGWDGTYQGKPAPQGTYTYKLEVMDLKNKLHTFLGHINLLR